MIQPQALDMEEVVLGEILLTKGALDEIINDLTPEAFYSNKNSVIYRAMLSLNMRNEPIDLLTVTHELKTTGELDTVGGPYYITTLTNRVASSGNIKKHVKIILQQYARREVIRICAKAVSDAYEDSTDIFELLERTDSQINLAKQSIIGKGLSMEWNDQLHDTFNIIERLHSAELKISGIPTGNDKLDSITGGWQKTDLIIVAGRPGSGKTTRALNFVKACCIHGYSCVIFSLEMGYRQIVRKFLNEQSEIYGNRLITGEISEDQLERVRQAKNHLSRFKIHLNDIGGITPSHMRNVIKQRLKKSKVDLIIVDYIQLMKPNKSKDNQSRDTEIGGITSGLKNIAKEFDLPIIALSQLSRKCEERNDKRPILSDLRESGNIEQDADLVIGLYRPSYYYQVLDKDRDYRDEQISQEEYQRISELHILKHRNGQSDRFIKEQFFGEFSRFSPEKGTEITYASPDQFIESKKIDQSTDIPF